MNEGKPTKGKWWSRPRPSVPGGDPSESGPGGPSGPLGAQHDPDDPAGSGDYIVAPARPAEPAPSEGTGVEGAPSGEDGGPLVDGDAAEGAPAPSAPSVSGQSNSTTEHTGSAHAASPGEPGGSRSPAAASADRPRPLHDPDPYSTPPYGEPGPWAPAPPVQHPGTTPARGTPIPPPPGATPAHGTLVAPPAAPVPYAAVPPQAPAGPVPAAPLPYPTASGPVTGPAGGPGQGNAVPGGRWHPYDPWAAPLHLNGAVPKGPRSRRNAVVGVVLVALLSGLLGGALGSYLERHDEGSDITLPQAGPESKNRPAGSVAGIAASALPGVVTIHVRGDSQEGTGTGFVLDGRGHILTNNHVVRPAGSDGEISVTFSGGQTAKGTVVGHDTGYDLAVIKVSGVAGLRPLPLGNSDNVQVGDPVVAIGAPFDLANTVTSGIISAKERPITTADSESSDGSDVSYVDALQTDAPINPGNSGGPLVDAKARVIGINSAIRSASGGQDSDGGQAGSIGLGFAIPVNQAKRVAEELINTGRATHPVIGVTLDMNYAGDGARVADHGGDGAPAVNKNGPAERAGIHAGDVVVRVDGAPVHSAEELIVRIRSHRPGDRLELTLRHGAADDTGDTGEGGPTRKVTLVLGAAKGD